ncbi:Luciferin 4-monooxygenase [Operophtera brumata]|uniref:Luciferin 4-monooxygenase n=1 Tax=Operophtera brumata TaxID=104452 RepID=A0A0L7KM50_OPEBR|nr:Luciferin 4-monooxygenase [Operophtera brumata]
MFCSPTAFDLHKTSFNTVGCIDEYIVYGDEAKQGGILFKNFLTEHSDVKDFLPVPVEGWKNSLMIMFSSGTTGLAKGIPLTHLGVIITSMGITNESFKGEGNLSTRAWYNSYGMAYTLAVLKEGAKDRFPNLIDVYQMYGLTEMGLVCNDL